MSDLTDPMVAAITALPPRVFHVGDPDPTPDVNGECGDLHRGYVCTWPKGHADSLPHVAGTGTTIAAVWGGAPVGAVTVTLTRAQAEALANLAELGVDEKRYDIAENHPYTEQEEAAALAECITAESAMHIITTALAGQENRA